MIQDGARRHYVVPVALQRAGILDRVFAEWYTAGTGVETAVTAIASLIRPSLGRRLRGRCHPEIDPQKVLHNPWLLAQQRLNRYKFNRVEAYYAWTSQQVGRWILRCGFGGANVVYGYIRNVDPAVFRACQTQGIKTIGDQMIAPGAIEAAEAEKQDQRWPGWELAGRISHEDALVQTEIESWAACDRITCGSQYVADGLRSQGVDPARVTVIPYAPSGANLPFVRRQNRRGPMTVGFVGAVNLRKGVPYFLKTARRFDPARVRFVMVGTVLLDAQVLEKEKGAVQIVGGAPRSDIIKWLTEFDVMLFPSTCEGCAGAVLEAMETGLPVIATPSSGTIISDGVDGFIRRYDDVEGFAELIHGLEAQPELRQAVGVAARRSVEKLNMDWYINSLTAMVEGVLEP
jgi:glycosyltransferase involved in cell wall biosynthesis